MVQAGALEGVRVLDLSGELGQYCGKLMGDQGADVIKVEPPAGDGVRRLGPFYEDVESIERSLYWHAMNTSKRAITLELETVRGREILHRLFATADIVVESFAPGTMAGWGMEFDCLQRQYPGLIMVSVTPFGQTGPYRDLCGTELEASALGGFLAVCGDLDRPPLRISQPQVPLFASINAYTGAMMAYLHRLRGGMGQQVDVSMQEAATNLHYSQLLWNTYGVVTARLGDTLSFGETSVKIAFPCKDGYIQAIPALSWDTFVPWLIEYDKAAALTTPEWQERLETLVTDWTQEEIDYALSVIADFFADFTKKELYEESIRRRQLLYPVQNVRDCLDDRQLQERGYFVEVDAPALERSLTYPGEPCRFSVTPWVIRGPAPRLGEHNDWIYGEELGLSEADRAELRQEGVI